MSRKITPPTASNTSPKVKPKLLADLEEMTPSEIALMRQDFNDSWERMREIRRQQKAEHQRVKK